MTPLRVYLCDLTHETVILVSDTIPINLGYIGAYAKKNHGNLIEISLFKYPNTVIDAIKKNPPDVLGLSNYSWNSLLSERIANVAKVKNPKVVTIQGGPNFPHDTEQQLEFLMKRPNTDFHIMFEGEASFSNLLDRVLKDRRNEQELFDAPVDGCVFIHPDKKKGLVKGSKPPRIKFLDDIPSPYLNGMLDDFFDGRLSPFIETNRGCPFKCTFCHTGNDYFQKIHMFSLERIKAELEYIGTRAMKQKNTILHVADVNFGMFPRDRQICEIIVDMQKKYKWPTSVCGSTGKNNKERIISATSILGDSYLFGMSVQSMDKKVLDNINRSNIKLETYASLNEHLISAGRSTSTDFIIGLPGETKESFLEGVRGFIDSGIDRVTIYTLMMLYGTKFRDPEYRAKFNMKGKFRIVPLNLGEYDGVKIFDYEEVCVENKDMSFNDYLDIRKLAVIIETILNNRPFEVFFRYALTEGISRFDFLLRILNNIYRAPKKIIDIFNEFKRESKEELWDSEIDLIKYYNRGENYQKLVKGDAGGNLIYKYKSMNLATAMPEWIEYLTSLLEDLVIEKSKKNLQSSSEQIESKHQEINILAEYHKNQTWKFLDATSSEENVTMESKYDFLAWLKGPKSQLLSTYRVKNPIRYFFAYTERQKKERYDQFRRYGTDINALSKIVVRIKPENWLRSVGTDPNLIKDKMDTKRSNTQYNMSH